MRGPSGRTADAIIERETVLVTGNSGLIGSAVVGLDVKGPPQSRPGADHIDVDISADDSVRDGLRQLRDRRGERVASVIHLAAYYDFSGEPSPKYDEITVRRYG
jgi:nucleoside-diphosphate-sugar epimerase